MFEKILLVTIAVLTLTGCVESKPSHATLVNRELYGIDQEKRIELFNQCLARVPVGPTAVKYNDWDELVETCDEISKSQAKKCVADCVLKDNNVTNSLI